MTSISEPADPMTDVAFGASVAGPAHVATGHANQDAWGYVGWSAGPHGRAHCAVVCDGLGSRVHAREGALGGVRAVKRAARQWAQAPGAPVSLLIRLVEVLWRLEVAPRPAGDCATTCLVVLVLPEASGRRVVILALGDGVVAVERAGGFRTLGGRADDQFSNTTTGLGIAHHMDAWQVLELSSKDPVRILLLSDGIADDVPAERIHDWFGWLAGFEGRPAAARGRALRRALRRWPVPGHTDDKTLVYLHVRERTE